MFRGSKLTGSSFLLSCVNVSVNGGRVVTVSDRPSFWAAMAERHATASTVVENYSYEDYADAKKSPSDLIESEGPHDFTRYDSPDGPIVGFDIAVRYADDLPD